MGYDDDRNLVNLIRKKPSCVVLFDEVEKANVDVLNVLLQILEDGKLTNSNGSVASFQETLIVLTSNIGSDIMNNRGNIGFRMEAGFKKSDVIAEVKRYFRPELINRLDEVVVFNHLRENDIYRILDMQLDELKKIMEKRGISFKVSDDVRKKIVDKCEYFHYGARPVRREIEGEIEDVIVDRIIKRELEKGESLLI